MKDANISKLVPLASILLILLLLLSGLPQTILFRNVSSSSERGDIINLKAALLVGANDTYAPPYSRQIAQNIMRNWGIPFDSFISSNVTAQTFWDSADQSNKYQFIVFEAAYPVDLPNSSVSAILQAIENGTNVMFVGASVAQFQNLFGLTNFQTCPEDYIDNCNSGNTTFEVTRNFTGILRGEINWESGDATTTSSDLPNLGLYLADWNGTGTEFIQNSANNGTFFPNVLYRTYGPNNARLWWFASVWGPLAPYRTGWPFIFTQYYYDNTPSGGNIGEFPAFQPLIDAFFYVMQNVTTYDIRMMPWATDGSAETIRAADHVSIYTISPFTSSLPWLNTSAVGLVGEINVDILGISESIPEPVSSSMPPNLIDPPCVPGYSYWGTVSGRASSSDVYDFALCAVVDNQTTASIPSNFVTVGSGGTMTQDINFTDGNTTEISDLRVLVNTSASSTWSISLLNSSNSDLWTSSMQGPVSVPTWIDFPQVDSRITQGEIKIALNVSSGAIAWWNSSTSAKMNYVVTGRSNWDLVYINGEKNDNFTNDKPLVPDSITMANGLPYPQDNATTYISGEVGRLHPANIYGENNTGPPTGVNFETFYNYTDWTTTPEGIAQIQALETAVADGWQIDPIGWTHAKSPVGQGMDNDFYFGNGSLVSPAVAADRVNDIVSMMNEVLGPGNWTKNWAFGTSYGSLGGPVGETAMVNAGFWFAFQNLKAEPYLGYIGMGYVRENSTGWSSLYDVPVRIGGKNPPNNWANGLNETRQTLGISMNPSDMNTPALDYYNARSLGFTQPYDMSSVWFAGTTERAFSFWNTTMSMLMNNTALFQLNQSSKNVVLEVDTGGSEINYTKFDNPIVFRFPVGFDGLSLSDVSDNESAGCMGNTTSQFDYYQINNGKEWTRINASYSSQPGLIGENCPSINNEVSNATVISSLSSFQTNSANNGTISYGSFTLSTALGSTSTYVSSTQNTSTSISSSHSISQPPLSYLDIAVIVIPWILIISVVAYSRRRNKSK